MTINASIYKNGQEFKVRTYRQIRCNACEGLLFETTDDNDKINLEIQCSRCKALWRITFGAFNLLRPPKRMTGKLLDNWEKFIK